MESLQKIVDAVRSLGGDAAWAFVWYLVLGAARTLITCATVVACFTIVTRLIQNIVGTCYRCHHLGENDCALTARRLPPDLD